jgi:hypothetical protein
VNIRSLTSRFILSLLLSSFSPALASNCYSQAEYELEREYQGWLDATCSYYVDGWITEDHARDVLRRVNLAFIGQMVLLRDQALKKMMGLKTRRHACDMNLGAIQSGLSFQYNE